MRKMVRASFQGNTGKTGFGLEPVIFIPLADRATSAQFSSLRSFSVHVRGSRATANHGRLREGQFDRSYENN